MPSSDWTDLIKQFKRRNIACEVVPDCAAALKRVQDLIKPGQSVSFTGCKTAHQCGIYQWLRETADENDFTLYDPYRPGLDWPERIEINKKGILADWMVAGANAITKSGEIVNLDGTCNRVAGISFGPSKVLIVAGTNKIVDNLDAAIKRVREVAAPLNSKKLKFGNPCEIDGKCHDCSSPRRICRVWGIVEGQMDPDRMTVLLVEEELGM
jgi:hypothetical protein